MDNKTAKKIVDELRDNKTSNEKNINENPDLVLKLAKRLNFVEEQLRIANKKLASKVHIELHIFIGK
jgi:hypothetical protein